MRTRFPCLTRLAAAALLLAAAAPALAFDANGVALGGHEIDVEKAFPSAYCKPLEWKSTAADRRCDDAEISFGGAEARITVYLKAGAIVAFDVVFDTKDLERVTAFLKSRYGKPLGETRDLIQRKGKADRTVYKARWEKGTDHAVLVAQLDKSRAQLSVSRGDFETEIYRVR